MADSYRIIGAEMSPYSVKVRSYFRYKAIPHQWVLRNAASQAEYEKYARMPIIPLLVTPEGSGIQDSTPIIDAMERLYPVAACGKSGASGEIGPSSRITRLAIPRAGRPVMTLVITVESSRAWASAVRAGAITLDSGQRR